MHCRQVPTSHRVRSRATLLRLDERSEARQAIDRQSERGARDARLTHSSDRRRSRRIAAQHVDRATRYGDIHRRRSWLAYEHTLAHAGLKQLIILICFFLKKKSS